MDHTVEILHTGFVTHDVKRSRVWGREVARFTVGSPPIAKVELPAHTMPAEGNAP